MHSHNARVEKCAMAASREIQETRQLFLWLMGCMYMFAFGSLYVQIPGMFDNVGMNIIKISKGIDRC